ncbi:hypothetical protein [Metaclostridioides mangenotii]|uniref:hypothetical protein n=1 Tax=Metaclostridioides mangenotii TaxID=1540 RepID=UPI001AEA61A3|nr:hypothetical protein [Clostridioides mangenotii]
MTYTVRLYITFKKEEDFESHCTISEDFGWGGKNSNIQYFKKIGGNIDDDIFYYVKSYGV